MLIGDKKYKKVIKKKLHEQQQHYVVMFRNLSNKTVISQRTT
jgi:hypothetical protein